MDLQAAHETNGTAWRFARLAALLLFAMAGALLVSALSSRAEATLPHTGKAVASLSLPIPGAATRP